MTHETSVLIPSTTCEGVRFRIARVSFARRVELIKRLREVCKRVEFHSAGSSVADRVQTAAENAEIDRMYLEWGLLEIEGLVIDDSPATPASTIEFGPEELCKEIVSAIKRECGLSEDERKN